MKIDRIGTVLLLLGTLLVTSAARAEDTSLSATPDGAAPAEQTPATQTPGVQPAPPKSAAPPAAVIKVNENVNFRFGLFLQPQADFQQNATATGYQQNLLLRRIRFLVGGQAAKNVFFFFQTENSRLGNATSSGTKTISSGFQVLDAVAEWRYRKEFNVWGGLIYLPTSREALKSSGSEFMIDQNTYAYTATGALGGTAGRDTGFMARGFLAADHFEYRAGVFSGLREAGNRNTFRKIARLQYNFFDTEPYGFPSYAGTYFGAKKIVALGAAYDTQETYHGKTADLFVEWPTAFGAAQSTITAQQLDGGKFSPVALAKSNIFTADAGLYFKGSKLGPWVRYERRNYDVAKTKNEKRALAGLNYYPWGNNFNVKAAYSRLTPAAGPKTNEFILQAQIFFF